MATTGVTYQMPAGFFMGRPELECAEILGLADACRLSRPGTQPGASVRDRRSVGAVCSLRRAGAVRDYFVSRSISSSRLRTASYGEENPEHANIPKKRVGSIAAWRS